MAIRIVITKIRYGVPREIKPEDSNFVIDTKKTKTVGILAGINRAELSRLVNVFILDKAATCVDTNSITKALKLWVVWLEETEIDPFSPAALHYKSPTYGFKEELLLKVNNHKSISYNTAANYINVIKNFYQFLGDINVLEPMLFFRYEQKFNGRGKAINATDLSIRPLRKHQGSSLNPLTKSECTVLLSIIEKLSRRDYLMIMLMLGCGLRGQEVITMNSCLFSSEVFSENESFLIQGLEIGPDVGIMTKFSIPRELFITKVLYEEVLDFVEDANYLRALEKAQSEVNNKEKDLVELRVQLESVLRNFEIGIEQNKKWTLGLDADIINVNGGAIALGHPLGCTGAKLSVQLFDEMRKRNMQGKYGMVTMCVGTGQGAAGIFEFLN